ncbi:unnamed protein product [Dibothriocephalus latus]|uniref:Uncharacterized protein n=1 Tax=Dibothriocephalus latus TaxID=60516 RepID=A0A3P7NLD7_DIBLA|nr:unnamed protein product [Dibothriocephalus latus]
MDYQQLLKELFYGDVTVGARCQGGQMRRYKDTLEDCLKRLQINTATWEELAQDRSTWRRTAKTGAAIHEASPIAAAKAKLTACKPNNQRTHTATAQALPTCLRCQRIFSARIGLVV